MDIGVNHYEILGLVGVKVPSKVVSKDEITKAYKLKAKEVHPDKRHHDPINAKAMFIQLQNSYELLKDDNARKLFDDHLLRLSKRDSVSSVFKREILIRRQGQRDPKRRKMMSELQERERSSFSIDPSEEEEERTFRQLQEEIARVAATHNAKKRSPPSKNDHRGGSDNDKVLKVLWKKYNIDGEEDYTAQKIFRKFGPVEAVVLCKKKKSSSSALVEMASKDAAVAPTRNVLSDRSNHLLRVERLQPDAEKKEPKVVNFGEDFENSVLEKMMKLWKLKDNYQLESLSVVSHDHKHCT